jgi:hypothetical protein
VDDGRHDDSVRGAVAAEAIDDEAVRHAAAPLEQLAKEPRGGVAIPAGLEQDVDDLTVLVDGPPKILTLTADGHEEFVQMPGVTDRPGPLPEPPRVSEAKVSHQCRMDSYETVMPRCARRSSTSRKLRVKR